MFFKRFKVDKSKAAAEPEVVTSPTPPLPQPDDAPPAGMLPEPATEKAAEPQLPKPVAPGSHPPLDPASLGFATTADVQPADGPIGQTRALEALAFGAGMKGAGYHMLVSGGDASGRNAGTRAKLQEMAAKAERPADWVYVSSFDSTGGFRALKLSAGTAKPFAERMAQAIEQLADALPAAFAADDYELRRRTIEEEFRFSREDALEALRREAQAQNIALLRTPAGVAVAPILEGKVVKTDVFNSLPETLRREVETKIAALETEIEAILTERPDAEKARRERLLALNEHAAGRHVRTALEDLRTEFAQVAGVESYLKAATRDLIRNAGLFVPADGSATRLPAGPATQAKFARYAVHVMATTTASSGAPVVQETNPTYANLFGRPEHAAAADGHAQVARIKSGALHRANGGFLLLDAEALLAAAGVPDALRRALQDEEIRYDPPTGGVGEEVPDLEPIPLKVKLVVLGDADALKTFAASYPQLRKLFKVEAVFDDAVERSADTVTAFARHVAAIVARHELRPIDAAGVAKLIDEAARKAGGNGKLSLETDYVADLCREADHWAGDAERAVTSGDDVERALRERELRGSEIQRALAS
jgi:predicted ATP-dependent protease